MIPNELLRIKEEDHKLDEADYLEVDEEAIQYAKTHQPIQMENDYEKYQSQKWEDEGGKISENEE